MAESSFDKLMQVSMGFTLPRTLHVVAELGIADALGEAPRNAEALATATGTDVEALTRSTTHLHVRRRRFGRYREGPHRP